jgi:hypothetical protein
MDMEAKQSYLTNWDVLLLCKCKKQGQCLRAHVCTAREISTGNVTLLSDHNICQHKKIAMQLTIPALLNGAPKRTVRAIGRCISTVMRDGNFLSVMEFLQFEEDGGRVLENDLHRRFDGSVFNHAVH